MISSKSYTTLLTLPLELRLKIWKYCLNLINDNDHVVRWRFTEYQRCWVPGLLPEPDQSPVIRQGWEDRYDSQSVYLKPNCAILRTCKQICNEVLPILYSQVFSFHNSKERLAWLKKIGPVNTRRIRHLDLCVYWGGWPAILQPSLRRKRWGILLEFLHQNVTGLQCLNVDFTDKSYRPEGDDPSVPDTGLDTEFVRALVKIPVSKSVRISGYYGVHWPRYLAEQMGVPVTEWWSDEVSQHCLDYQKGTESVIP